MMREIHKWTDEEKEFLRQYVTSHTWKKTTEEFNQRFKCNLSVDAVKAAGDRYGIRTGRDGYFPKGTVPPNKGKKMRAEQYARCAATMFKKGQIPANHKPVGTVSIRNNYKRNQQYVYEKVAEPNKWRMKHVLEWERHNGPVPKGMIIVFADGNTLNTDISNLVMISQAQNAVMNRWKIRGCGKEHMEAAANVASLKIQISKRKRRGKQNGSKRAES